MTIQAYLAAMTAPFILLGLDWTILLFDKRAERRRERRLQARTGRGPQ
jgi:hypothetical protein